MFNMPSGKLNWSHLKTCNCGESSSNSDPIIHYGSRCMYSQNTLIDIESLTHSNGTDREIKKIKLNRKIHWKWKLCVQNGEYIISIENSVIWCLRVCVYTMYCSIVCRNCMAPSIPPTLHPPPSFSPRNSNNNNNVVDVF